MSEPNVLYLPAVRKRFDQLCQQKNEEAPLVVINRKVERNGKLINQEVHRQLKAVSDGAQTTGKAMIKSFAHQFAIAAKFLGTNWLEVGDFPPFKTNSTKLAKFRGNVSPRTVRTHLKQLKDIGFIVDYKFHGSNANFELWLCPHILFGDALKPYFATVEESNFTEKSTTEKPVFKNTNDTNLPHRHVSSRVTISETKNTTTSKVEKSHSLQKLNYGNSHSQTEILTERKDSAKMATKKSGGGGQKNVDNTVNKPVGNTKHSWMNNLDHFTPPGTKSDYRQLTRSQQHYVTEFWRQAKMALWPTQNFIPEESFAALDVITMSIYKPIFNTKPSENALQYFHQLQLKAIEKAEKFYNKSETSYPGHPFSKFKAGTGYFDSQNSFGFKVAQRWVDEDKAKNHERYGEKLLKTAIRHIQNHPKGKAPQKYQSMSMLQLFQHYEGKLKSYGKDIQTDFYQKVSRINSKPNSLSQY